MCLWAVVYGLLRGWSGGDTCDRSESSWRDRLVRP